MTMIPRKFLLKIKAAALQRIQRLISRVEFPVWHKVFAEGPDAPAINDRSPT